MKGFPWAAVTAVLLLLASLGLSVGGTYELAGLGWAMLVGAMVTAFLAGLILRGLK